MPKRNKKNAAHRTIERRILAHGANHECQVIAQRFAILQHNLLQRLTVQSHLSQVCIRLYVLQVSHAGRRCDLHEPLKAGIPGDKVCLTVYLHHSAGVSLYQHPDQTLGGVAALELGRLRPAQRLGLLAEPLLGLCEIIVVQLERFLAVCKRVPGLFAQRGEGTLFGGCIKPDSGCVEETRKVSKQHFASRRGLEKK
uniref:Uncharacterized protein n=1 Tax=Anopheles atroparvus TaxID=41427 RepID=A0A182J4B9_ANOAO